jgi:hypothetical protein
MQRSDTGDEFDAGNWGCFNTGDVLWGGEESIGVLVDF